ncbi:MAG: murein biosynthesis integral membrane protein MurJ, partial [Acidimicrobiia bacterium]|nr:murein biosynthesis integral membrane protein MurJ [Acidimicrobiia bacterium]
MTESQLRRRIGSAALVVGVGVLLSRILGLVREQVAAAILGGTANGDVYQAAFTIADWINYLLAGGFMSITFIPIYTRFLANNDAKGGATAFIAIARPVAIAMTALIGVGWLAAPAVLDVVYPGFGPDELTQAVRLTRIVLPAQLFFIIGSLLMAVQYANGEFVIPTLAPIVYNLGIIIGGLAFNLVSDTPDPAGFAWGVLGGAVVGNFLIQAWGAHRVGLRIQWSTPWAHPVLRQYVVLAVPLMVGQSIVVLDEQFLKSFGSLVSEGAVVQLIVARRSMFVPVGVIAQAAGVAAYPFLSRLFEEGRLAEMASTVTKALRYVLVLSLAAGALLAALSVPVIRVLFQRGLFDAGDTLASANALFFYALAVPVWGALQIITRGFYARREMWVPVAVGTAAAVLAFPLYWSLRSAYGIKGVALASTLG